MTTSPARLTSIDVLRGLAMVVMALDHTRDFFSEARFDPTDLSHTTPLLFFTRWITHFCAPIFVLLAGTGAYLSLGRGKTTAELSRFLFTRGLWLIFLEIAVITPLGWAFSFSYGFTRLQVIWVIGCSMVILAGLIRVMAPRWIAGLGLILIFGHDLFDGGRIAWLGPAAQSWKLLHNLSFFQPLPHKIVGSLYPLIPWVGVMALGFGAGGLLSLEAARRKTILLRIGVAATALFILLRAANVYGDPSAWSGQKDGLYTLMSFLNCSKYPPSLLYLLMTLGPAICALALFNGGSARFFAPLATFGRVPLFYYLLHLPLLHGAAVLFSLVRYGQAPWMFQDMMALRNSPHPLPAGYGYNLAVVYAVWLAAVLLLYPACRWFADVKRNNGQNAILSYL